MSQSIYYPSLERVLNCLNSLACRHCYSSWRISWTCIQQTPCLLGRSSRVNLFSCVVGAAVETRGCDFETNTHISDDIRKFPKHTDQSITPVQLADWLKQSIVIWLHVFALTWTDANQAWSTQSTIVVEVNVSYFLRDNVLKRNRSSIITVSLIK
jgi:hypothetical protein